MRGASVSVSSRCVSLPLAWVAFWLTVLSALTLVLLVELVSTIELMQFGSACVDPLVALLESVDRQVLLPLLSGLGLPG